MGLPAEEKKKLYAQYRSLLLDGVAPFWLKRGIDRGHGGVLSCMSDDNQVLSGDKFIWSQARSVAASGGRHVGGRVRVSCQQQN
jgi:mannose/cellobiose epimerase-like protein (N-acyl-D-glucosamine 2-epimerase family)